MRPSILNNAAHQLMVRTGILDAHYRHWIRRAAKAHITNRLEVPFPDSFRILIGVTVDDGIPESPVPAVVNVP